MIETLIIIALAPLALLTAFFCLSIIACMILELKDIFK